MLNATHANDERCRPRHANDERCRPRHANDERCRPHHANDERVAAIVANSLDNRPFSPAHMARGI